MKDSLLLLALVLMFAGCGGLVGYRVGYDQADAIASESRDWLLRELEQDGVIELWRDADGAINTMAPIRCQP